MHFQYNPYIWIYLGGAVLLLLVTVYMAYKRNANRFWTITQIMVILWCLGFALRISGTDLALVSICYITANDFVGLKTPIFWLLWTLIVAGRKSWITWRRVALLLILPLITDILNLTNAWHGLMYHRLYMDTSGQYAELEYICGFWYWVITVYCGILLLAVIIVQLKAAFNRELLYWKQGLTISAATAAILILIIKCVIDPGFLGFDPIPVAISIASVFTSIVFRFRVQEAVPVPRNVVMEKMTSAVLILDNHNRVMDLNPAAEDFFGLKNSKVAGCVFEDVLSGWPELAVACRDRSIGHREFSRDGRYYEAYFSGLNDGRKAVGRLVVIQDVTANKRAEAQLVQQQQVLLVLRERERLARELHDSLGQVLSYTNIQIQTIREMLKNSQLAAVDDNLARLSQVITEANTEVREFIHEVKATLFFKNGFFTTLHQYLARFERNFQIRTELQNPDHLSEEDINLTDGVQLFRIIQEALANVRKHAQASKVTIIFQKEKQQLRILVVDNGIGFEPGNLRTDQSSFGLEVMRERAAQCGGMVRIDAAPGRGTTVTITIPRLAGMGQRSRRLDPKFRSDMEETNPKIRILLADDHALFMEGLQNLLTPKGFEVVGMARDGLEALEKARLLYPEMILMDLQMPRCNGLTATRLIKAEMPEIKIVILTMSSREQDLLEAIKNGAAGYLLKGLQADELVNQLTSLVSGAAIISPELAAQVLDEYGRKEADTAVVTASNTVEPEMVLSPKQVEILKLVAEGYTYKEVAAKLFVSERTIKYQMAEILRELHFQTRRQAIAFARKARLGKENGKREA